jgi:hypothetical protein
VRGVLAIALLAACRFNFDAQATGGDDTGDAPPQPRVDCAGHETALFCDGFEDPALSAWKIDGMASRATATRMHGAAALQVDTPGSQQLAQAKVTFAPVTSGLLAARGWFFVPAQSDVLHFDLIDIKSSVGDLAVLGYFDHLVIYQNLGTPGVGPETVTVPLDRWMCIEVQIQVSDPGRIDLWLDDVLVSSITNIDALPSTGFTWMAVGLPWTDDGQTALRAFVDEVIIDTKPIGCD